MRNRPLITLILLVVVIACTVALLNLLTPPSDRNHVDIGLLMDDIRHGKVVSLTWEGTLITGTYVNGQTFRDPLCRAKGRGWGHSREPRRAD